MACKALGVGADVYYAKDRTKYTKPTEDKPAEPAQKPAAQPAQPPQAEKPELAAAGQVDYIMQIANKDQMDKMRKAYGEHFEKMTRKDATNVIAKLRKVNGIE